MRHLSIPAEILVARGATRPSDAAVEVESVSVMSMRSMGSQFVRHLPTGGTQRAGQSTIFSGGEHGSVGGTFRRIMKVFVAGATGVVGSRLVRLLVGEGHEVGGLTRSADHAPSIIAAGAAPIVCDVFDGAALTAAVVGFGPDTIVDELTDLPDDAAGLDRYRAANARIRREGTANLLAAAAAAGASTFVVQSVAWTLPGDSGAAVAEMERMVLDAGGTVVRYGQFYGPGTYHEREPPPPPRIHVDEAAERTLSTLSMHGAVIDVVEEPG